MNKHKFTCKKFIYNCFYVFYDSLFAQPLKQMTQQYNQQWYVQGADPFPQITTRIVHLHCTKITKKKKNAQITTSCSLQYVDYAKLTVQMFHLISFKTIAHMTCIVNLCDFESVIWSTHRGHYCIKTKQLWIYS